MSMNQSFLDALAAHGASLITHIGLVDELGVEVSGGSYARLAVTWAGGASVQSPSTDLVFDIPAGGTVAGWRGYTALSGGTDHGGAALTQADYTNAGTYTLLAASTNFNVTAV